MSLRRRFITSALLAMGCYLLLLVLWFPLAGVWRAGFAGVGNVVLGRIGAHGRVQFEPMAEPEGVLDTHWRFSNTREGIRKSVALSVRYHTYVPFAVLSALVIATPVSWRRRKWALAAGVVLVGGFVFLRLWLRSLDMFMQEPAPLFRPGGPWPDVVGALVHLTYHSPLSSVVAPSVIWIMVTFRRGDWSRLRDGTVEPAPRSEPEARARRISGRPR